MLSYNWDHQSVIKRVNSALQSRGYTVWIDIEKMQGSTVEVMADAVEDAAVMCYGVSRAYKESANCRLEAQYAYQRQKEMVPLMLEERYRANGWLGMLLGVRLWYAFCGSVLLSESAFEGKMEELCRELGDRGKEGTVSPKLVSSAVASDSDTNRSSLSSLLLNDVEGARTTALEESLVSVASILPSLGRKTSKALMLRVDVLLDQLADVDDRQAAAWVGAEWASEHVDAVAEAMVGVRTMESESPRPQDMDVASTVTALVEAVELVVASHVGMAEALRASLESGGGNGAVVSVLEHGLEVLEALSVSSPRKQRKSVRSMCERVESVLEGSTEVMGQVSMCGVSELECLVECLCEVSGLCVGEVTAAECVATVRAALDELARCSDPVLGASELVQSAESEDRMRGLRALRDLERVVLDEAVEAEVSVVLVVLEVGADRSRSDGERTMAWMGMFALCLRNCRSCTVRSHFVDSSEWTGTLGILTREVYSGDRKGGQGLDVWISFHGIYALFLAQLPLKFEGDDRRLLEGAISQLTTVFAQEHCSLARLDELMPHILDTVGGDDLVLASSAVLLCGHIVIGAPVHATRMVERGLHRTVWQAYKRIASGKPASWWKERADLEHLPDTLNTSILGMLGAIIVPNLASLPYDDVWDAILAEAVHLIKVNKEAELSAQARMSFWSFYSAARLVSKAVDDTSRHAALLATGVVEPLLYMTAHGFTFIGTSLGASAASVAVNLIGRNEGGLTLSREAVDSVLRDFQSFFVPNTRRGRYAPNRALTVAKSIVSMVISDANKAFVVEHSGAIDTLVDGLLLDESNPRRTEKGGDELQATCALALQNLALSDVGKMALQAYAGAMEGLRRVAAADGSVGMSVQARQYASGALFELDESTRRAQRSGASAPQGAAPVVVEHVMLSYNWDHQSVIKRVNSALQSRGYTVWIDIEKMQGSTVEVMADAVEDAAVMCYGVSRAYKESANCRLEAQYAYQQQKEMVPLMLEERYRANGWLGMLLGVRMWYAFCGSVLLSESAFEGKMEELCRELGDRGREPSVAEVSRQEMPFGGANVDTNSLTTDGSAQSQPADSTRRTLSLSVESERLFKGRKKVTASVCTLQELSSCLQRTLGLSSDRGGALGLWLYDAEFGEYAEVTALQNFETDKAKIRVEFLEDA
eukprot:COSAG05_NODE_237_length_13170_cov_25.700558_5_plen_1165_part_00